MKEYCTPAVRNYQEHSISLTPQRCCYFPDRRLRSAAANNFRATSSEAKREFRAARHHLGRGPGVKTHSQGAIR